MAEFGVWTNGKLYVDGYDFSGDLNEIRASVAAAAVPASRFGSAWDEFLPGTKRVSVSSTGIWRAESDGVDPDAVFMTNLGVLNKVLSVWPSGVDGEIGGVALRSVQGAYAPLAGRYGEALPFTTTFEASVAPVLLRPTLLHPATARTLTATGVARQVGAVLATQKLYAFLHVLGVSGTGPTLDVIVQSDNAEGFASAENRITFAQQSAIGSVWATPVDGAITDDWWRVSYTIGGSGTPTFTFVVGIAIL